MTEQENNQIEEIETPMQELKLEQESIVEQVNKAEETFAGTEHIANKIVEAQKMASIEAPIEIQVAEKIMAAVEEPVVQVKEKTFYGFHLRLGMKEKISALAAITDKTKANVINDAIQIELTKYSNEITALLKLKPGHK
jgi:predicted DNA-binding protein